MTFSRRQNQIKMTMHGYTAMFLTVLEMPQSAIWSWMYDSKRGKLALVGENFSECIKWLF